MSKFGWDLPPGCSTSDIPGNRPEDAQAEQMAEDVYEAMKPLQAWIAKNHSDEAICEEFERAHEEAEMALMKLLDKYYGAGFKDGIADERYTREMAEIYDAEG